MYSSRSSTGWAKVTVRLGPLSMPCQSVLKKVSNALPASWPSTSLVADSVSGRTATGVPSKMPVTVSTTPSTPPLATATTSFTIFCTDGTPM